MRRNFLVTGGCGFIGSHLVEYLLETGNSVTIIDDLSTGSKRYLVDDQQYCSLIVARVEDTKVDELGHFDCVFHLAAQTSVPYSVENFYGSSSTNLVSSLRVIDYCSRVGIPLVYASSSAVYGNLSMGDESAGTDLISPYATDKLVSELYCETANRLYGLKSYGLRFFNVYGPRQDPSNPYSGVISIFADRILRQLPIYINGGHQTRDFIFVKDIVSGIWASYLYLLDHPVATYSNLLTGHSVSIDDLAILIMNITGKTVNKVYRDLPAGDPTASLGSTARMDVQLKLPGFINLKAGLSDTIKWIGMENERT